MGQFAILVLQRDVASGLLRHAFVLEVPVEADTPESAIAEFQRWEASEVLLGRSPEWTTEVIARRAVFEHRFSSGEVAFSQDRRHYLTTEQVQEITWFHILRSAWQRQNWNCALDPKNWTSC